MGVYILADRIAISETDVVYHVKLGDKPEIAQDVRIPLNSTGACLSENDIHGTTGESLTITSDLMVGKLLRLRGERGEWPERAAFQG